MATPESKVKKQITDFLKSQGVYYFFPVAMGMGRSGIPDIICCVRGFFVAIECKAGKGTTTALQDKNIADIQRNKGIALVVNEHNQDHMQQIVKELLRD